MDPIVSDKKFYIDHQVSWGPGLRTVMLSFANGRQQSDNDIAVRYGMKPKTVSARRTELWRWGFVGPIGMKKIKRQQGQIWCATPKGQEQIRHLLTEEHLVGKNRLGKPFSSFMG